MYEKTIFNLVPQKVYSKGHISCDYEIDNRNYILIESEAEKYNLNKKLTKALQNKLKTYRKDCKIVNFNKLFIKNAHVVMEAYFEVKESFRDGILFNKKTGVHDNVHFDYNKSLDYLVDEKPFRYSFHFRFFGEMKSFWYEHSNCKFINKCMGEKDYCSTIVLSLTENVFEEVEDDHIFID